MKSVLITGGTGSFGRAFTKRLLATEGVKRVAILSRGEFAQAQMAEDFNDPRLRFFVGDVRDRDRLTRAFAGADTIIHAAALKRIEVGHYNPDEMVKTNVIGTMNVIEAATDAKVKRVVGLSSDKAFQPVSAYGQSKALAETLLMNANNMRGRNGPVFRVVRYGNVAGSRGSVIPKWREMIMRGAEVVPVSDPDCTRFYMRMDEAVGLVMRATKERSDDIIIPELPAYRLGDLAEAMGVKMDVRGLPEWEKKHEGMGPGNTSDVATRMSRRDLTEALAAV
jgi:UDP-N-acetylglucosamine 4,6-dehydratase